MKKRKSRDELANNSGLGIMNDELTGDAEWPVAGERVAAGCWLAALSILPAQQHSHSWEEAGEMPESIDRFPALLLGPSIDRA